MASSSNLRKIKTYAEESNTIKSLYKYVWNKQRGTVSRSSKSTDILQITVITAYSIIFRSKKNTNNAFDSRKPQRNQDVQKSWKTLKSFLRLICTLSGFFSAHICDNLLILIGVHDHKSISAYPWYNYNNTRCLLCVNKLTYFHGKF